MATTQAPSPTITNAGNSPKIARKLFVTLPVNDLQRSIRFFEALGFTFSPQFTDATATCMLVGADAYVMLGTKEKFASLTDRRIADAAKETTALFSVSMSTRAEVDEIVHKAVAQGGKAAREPEDHGFMYDWSFYDLDGNGWGVFWMDPAAIPAQ